MALRELLLSFGIEVSGREQLTDVEKKAGAAAEKIQTLVSAVAGLSIAKGLESFITSTIKMGASIADVSNRLGIGTDDLQQWQYAAKMVGVSGEQAGNLLRFFNRHLGLTEDGNKAASKDFAALGINIKDATGHLKPMSQLLPETADAFAKLKDDAQRTEYAVKLFGRAGIGVVPMLRDGSDGLRKMYEEFENLGGGIDGDAIKMLKEADRGLTRLGLVFDVLRAKLVVGMLPAFEYGMTKLMQFFRYMQELSDRTFMAQNALLALGATALIIFSPFLAAIAPVVALATGLFLIFDDILTLFEGGESVIGDFIDTLYGEGAHKEFVEDTKKKWAEFITWVEETGVPALKNFGRWMVKAFEDAAPAVKWLIEKLEWLTEAFGAFKDMVKLGATSSHTEGTVTSKIPATPGLDKYLYNFEQHAYNERRSQQGVGYPGDISDVSAVAPPPTVTIDRPRETQGWGPLAPPANVSQEINVTVHPSPGESGKEVVQSISDAQGKLRSGAAAVSSTIGGD